MRIFGRDSLQVIVIPRHSVQNEQHMKKTCNRSISFGRELNVTCMPSMRPLKIDMCSSAQW